MSHVQEAESGSRQLVCSYIKYNKKLEMYKVVKLSPRTQKIFMDLVKAFRGKNEADLLEISFEWLKRTGNLCDQADKKLTDAIRNISFELVDNLRMTMAIVEEVDARGHTVTSYRPLNLFEEIRVDEPRRCVTIKLNPSLVKKNHAFSKIPTGDGYVLLPDDPIHGFMKWHTLPILMLLAEHRNQQTFKISRADLWERLQFSKSVRTNNGIQIVKQACKEIEQCKACDTVTFNPCKRIKRRIEEFCFSFTNLHPTNEELQKAKESAEKKAEERHLAKLKEYYNYRPIYLRKEVSEIVNDAAGKRHMITKIIKERMVCPKCHAPLSCLDYTDPDTKQVTGARVACANSAFWQLGTKQCYLSDTHDKQDEVRRGFDLMPSADRLWNDDSDKDGDVIKDLLLPDSTGVESGICLGKNVSEFPLELLKSVIGATEISQKEEN